MRNVICSIVIVFAAQALAQPPAFEGATIKPSDVQGQHSHSNPGMMALSGLTLKGLIARAYEVEIFQVEGGPKWTGQDRFDVNAKAEGAASGPQLLQMLQTLLADRFQLTLHHETKIASAFQLVVAKSGLKVKAAEGAAGSHSQGGKGRLEAQGLTMEELAKGLSRDVGGPVVDMTGVKGRFDFTLEWAVDGDANDVQSALLAALPQQLGLKLEMKRVPLDFLVVDKAEKPSEN